MGSAHPSCAAHLPLCGGQGTLSRQPVRVHLSILAVGKNCKHIRCLISLHEQLKGAITQLQLWLQARGPGLQSPYVFGDADVSSMTAQSYQMPWVPAITEHAR